MSAHVEDEIDKFTRQLFKERYEKKVDVPNNAEHPDFRRAKKELRIVAQKTIISECSKSESALAQDLMDTLILRRFIDTYGWDIYLECAIRVETQHG